MRCPAHNRFVNIYIAITDLYIETTFGVSASPCFVMDRGALATVVRQRNQYPLRAFLTFRHIILFHETLLCMVEQNLVYLQVNWIVKILD